MPANRSDVRANKRLLSPDPAALAGAAGVVVPSGPSTEPTAVPTVTAPAVAPSGQPQGSPPVTIAPAAQTVIDGDVTEETLRLRETLNAKDAEIEELKRQVKDREITVCEYQDKLHSLTQPTPVPVTKAAQPIKYSFLRRRC